MYESVPNVSSADPKIFEAIVDIFKASKVQLLDASRDEDHGRSVFTLVGEENHLGDALSELVAYCLEHIDLREHQGLHPRMGAVDVIPLIGLGDTPLEETIAFSKRLARHIYETYRVPIFFYEHSASAEHRRPLQNLRRGGFEAMKDKLKSPEFRPDFGYKLHPSFGIVAIGAREFLIAYNVLLDSDDLELAQSIAKTIRENSGGMKKVKALGFYLEDKKKVQVSMNLVDYHTTNMGQVYEAIRELAEKQGVGIISSELIGLIPKDALIKSFASSLKLDDFSEKRIIEEAVKGAPCTSIKIF